MKKGLKKGLLITVAVILVLIVVLMLSLGSIIKTGIETAGPKIVGVSMRVEKVGVNLLTGVVHIKALVIGNPEGFNTPSAMELGEFKADLAMGSLFTDTIVIKQILIDAPQITYEKSLKSSNLSTLQKNLAPEKTATPAEKTGPATEKKKGSAKKVIIDDFQLTHAKVNVTLTAMGGKKMTLPLPDIKMQGIGRDSGGTSPAEVVSEVFDSITKAVTDAVASGGAIAADSLKSATSAAGDAAKEATDAAKDAAGSIKKGIGGLLGK
jgi:uncharacterized protein involved in outer membrane biogenesis